MAGEGKVDVEIIYGVPCGHLGMAIWMATEFSAAGDRDVALTLTPGTYDVLQVYIDGEKLYDKHAEQNQFPTLPRVKQMREVVRARLASAPEAPSPPGRGQG
jgi:predicted Rdx family selenoprotein